MGKSTFAPGKEVDTLHGKKVMRYRRGKLILVDKAIENWRRRNKAKKLAREEEARLRKLEKLFE